jgi:hypothetical protein
MHTPWGHLVRIMVLLKCLPNKRQSDRSLLRLLPPKILLLAPRKPSIWYHLRFSDFERHWFWEFRASARDFRCGRIVCWKARVKCRCIISGYYWYRSLTSCRCASFKSTRITSASRVNFWWFNWLVWTMMDRMGELVWILVSRLSHAAWLIAYGVGCMLFFIR